MQNSWNVKNMVFIDHSLASKKKGKNKCKSHIFKFFKKQWPINKFISPFSISLLLHLFYFQFREYSSRFFSTVNQNYIYGDNNSPNQSNFEALWMSYGDMSPLNFGKHEICSNRTKSHLIVNWSNVISLNKTPLKSFRSYFWH